jgi:hypothetical protein
MPTETTRLKVHVAYFVVDRAVLKQHRLANAIDPAGPLTDCMDSARLADPLF